MPAPPKLDGALRRAARARRQPWLAVGMIAAAAATIQWFGTVSQAIDFGTGDDDVYVAWAEAPVFERSGIAVVILLVAAALLSLRRLRPRARNAVLGVALICAGAIDASGAYETYARHHMRSELIDALATVPAPPGAVLSQPIEVSDDGGDPLNGLPGEPGASESWTTQGGGAGACAAIVDAVAQQPRMWTGRGNGTGLCEYRRVRGRVLLIIRVEDVDGTVISALAFPHDEG